MTGTPLLVLSLDVSSVISVGAKLIHHLFYIYIATRFFTHTQKDRLHKNSRVMSKSVAKTGQAFGSVTVSDRCVKMLFQCILANFTIR